MSRQDWQRAHSRNWSNSEDSSEARLDRQSLEFHKLVAEGYRKIAALEPRRFRMVDGRGSPGAVAERIWNAVSGILPLESRATEWETSDERV